MKRAIQISTAAIAAVLAVPAAGQKAGEGADANWQRIVQCANERSEGRRHDCMDNVLRSAGILDPVREIAIQRETFGQVEPPGDAAAPSADTAPTATLAPLPPAPEEIRSLKTTVAEALVGRDRKLLVATGEGAVWKQTDDEQIRNTPREGSDFEIERTLLGGYRCKVGGKVYRCERLD